MGKMAMVDNNDQQQGKLKPHHVAISLGTLGGGLWGLVEPNSLLKIAGNTWESEFTKMTVAFVLAAWVLRRWMRKDFEKLIDAVNNVASTLGNRLGKVEDDVSKLSFRVESLEKK